MDITPTKEEYLAWFTEWEQFHLTGATPDFHRDEFEQVLATCFERHQPNPNCMDNMYRDIETKFRDIAAAEEREAWLAQQLIKHIHLRPTVRIDEPRKQNRCFWAILLSDAPEDVTKSTRQIKLTVPYDWPVHHLLHSLPGIANDKYLVQMTQSWCSVPDRGDFENPVHVWRARNSTARPGDTIKLSDEAAYKRLVANLKSTDRLLIWKHAPKSEHTVHHHQRNGEEGDGPLICLPRGLDARVPNHLEAARLPKEVLDSLLKQPTFDLIVTGKKDGKEVWGEYVEPLNWEAYMHSEQAKELLKEFDYDSESEGEVT